MLREFDTRALRVNAQAQLGAAFAVIHTVGYQAQLTVTLIHIVNTTANAATIRLCVHAEGAAAAAGNAVLWDYSIPANDFIEIADGMILYSRWAIEARTGTAGAITLLVCGVEQ